MSLLHAVRRNKYSRLIIVALLVIVGLLYFTRAYSAQLPSRSIMLSNNTQGATSTYKLSFNLPSTATLGSIKLMICANSPIDGDVCNAPAGFSFLTATLANQTGETGFTISPATTANELILTRTAVAGVPGPVSYTLNTVTNPASPGSYYGRTQTFATEDASGPENEFGGLAFSINASVSITATVPPYLLFCSGVVISGMDCGTANGNYVNFGTLTPVQAKSGQTEMVAATNAENGYSIAVDGTTMTSGNNVISAISGPDVSRPGTNQFGINLVGNVDPAVGANPAGGGVAAPLVNYAQTNRYMFSPSATLASSPTPDLYKKFTVSYVVNVSKDQAPGVYVSTLTYVCTASF